MIPERKLNVKPLSVGAFLKVCDKLKQDAGDVPTIVGLLLDLTDMTQEEINGLLITELKAVFKQVNEQLGQMAEAAVPPLTAPASEPTPAE